jgi:hypothetical protein
LPLLADQLVNLTFLCSTNAQVPYLLRAVFSNRFKSLRSLGIEQQPSRAWGEGSRWDEDDNGIPFQRSKREAPRGIDSVYIQSLARAVPDIEELELKGQFEDTVVRTRPFASFS